MKHAILVVDDEIDNVDALERLFRKRYLVHKATSGAKGLEILKSEKVALIISDQRMPHMTGVEFLKRALALQPEAIRVLLTGYTDIESIIGAVNTGEIYRYLTKPWDPVDLVNTVNKAVEKYELRAELETKNKDLRKALDELKTLDESKSHFMILINHELKTPLTVILSFLGLLKETDLNEEQARYADRIETSATKLKKIVEDVLELVSAETGVLKVSANKVSVKKLIDSSVKNFKEAMEYKGQELEADLGDFKVRTDEQLAHKILSRIVENAVKFGEKNEPIRVLVEARDQDRARITVINRGKGPSAGLIARMLKPFTLDEDVMHHSSGLGLGLSLCQALLKRQGSELHMECPRGEVRVSFELPLA